MAFDTSQAILFDPAPTKIENVTIEELGADYTVVSWDTNHFTKNNKVNYGTDLKYGQSAWGEDYAKHHTIKLTGLKPGREIGVILNTLLEDVLEDPSLNTEEYLTTQVKELMPPHQK